MIVVAILVGMIDPFSAAFGIAAGIVWAKGSPWVLALVAAFLALVIGLQIANHTLSGYYLFTQSCALGLWATIAFFFAKSRQKAAAAAKERQILKP